MEKKKINKLVVPLTLKSVSLLGAFTIMTTSIGGCASKKKNKEEADTTSIISSTSSIEEENVSDVEITSSLISSINVDSSETVTSTEEITSSQDTTTSNSQSSVSSKPSQQKPNTSSKPSTSQSSSSSSTTQYDVYDPYTLIPLTKDNINDISIFKRAARNVSHDTAKGLCIWYYYYKGKTYTCYEIPKDEFTYLLASLNQDYLTDETLNSLLGSYSEDDLKRFTYILGVMFGWIKKANVINSWDGLIIDSNIKKQFIDIEEGYLEYLNNNNPKPLQELLDNYDYNGNPLVGAYLGCACSAALGRGNFEDEYIKSEYGNVYFDEYERSEQEASKMYNRIHGKTKVLE